MILLGMFHLKIWGEGLEYISILPPPTYSPIILINYDPLTHNYKNF